MPLYSEEKLFSTLFSHDHTNFIDLLNHRCVHKPVVERVNYWFAYSQVLLTMSSIDQYTGRIVMLEPLGKAISNSDIYHWSAMTRGKGQIEIFVYCSDRTHTHTHILTFLGGGAFWWSSIIITRTRGQWYYYITICFYYIRLLYPNSSLTANPDPNSQSHRHIIVKRIKSLWVELLTVRVLENIISRSPPNTNLLQNI